MPSRRSQRPISSRGSREHLSGCGRIFVSLFLIVWGIGFGGGGVMILSDDSNSGAMGTWARYPLASIFLVAGGLAIAFGVAIALGIRMPWRRRSLRPQPDPQTERISTPDDPADGPRTLRAESRRGCALLFLIPFTLLWGGVVWFLFAKSGEPGGPPTFMAVIFGLFGVGLILATVHQLLSLTNPRAELDLDAAEVPIGESVTIPWRLVGSTARISTLTIELVGREEASYTRGTDRVTDRHEFHAETLLERTVSRMEAGGELEFRLPDGAVPTFEARSNKILWSVRFKAPIRLWPDVADEILLPVGPQPTTERRSM